MPKITKKQALSAVAEINDLLQPDPLLKSTSKSTVASIAEELKELSYLPEDFQKGKEGSLSISTVRTIKGLKVTYPPEWDATLKEIARSKVAIEPEVQDCAEEKPEVQDCAEEKPEVQDCAEEKPEVQDVVSPLKSSVGVNFLGHRNGSGNDQLDKLMLKSPFTIDDLVAEGWKRTRVSNHLGHLKRDKKDLVAIKKDVEGNYSVTKRKKAERENG